MQMASRMATKRNGFFFKQRKVSEAHLVMWQASGTTPKPKGLMWRPDIDEYVDADTCNKSTCLKRQGQPWMLLPSVVSVNSSSNNDSGCEKSRRKKASDQTFHMIID